MWIRYLTKTMHSIFNVDMGLDRNIAFNLQLTETFHSIFNVDMGLNRNIAFNLQCGQKHCIQSSRWTETLHSIFRIDTALIDCQHQAMCMTKTPDFSKQIRNNGNRKTHCNESLLWQLQLLSPVAETSLKMKSRSASAKFWLGKQSDV